MSTQLTTSHSELPKMLRTSLIKGMEVFLLKIVVFSNLKLPTGHLSLVNLQVINMAGDVWLVQFLAHLVFYQMSLCNHDLSIVHSCRPASALASSGSVHSPPSHRIQDRNFIFSMNMHMCPQYMHIKYLVILTCSF